MEEIDNLTKNKNQSRTLLLKKLNKSNSQINNIKAKISEFFLSPDKFLEDNNKILINRKINLKKIIPSDLQEKQNLQKQHGKKDSFSLKNTSAKSSNLRAISNHKNNNMISKDENSNISLLKNFEVIDKEKLKSIFISFKNSKQTRNKKNKILTDEDSKDIKSKFFSEADNTKNIPSSISSYLDVQNRRLIKKKNIDKKSRETSKYLSRKLHKKENDLLFNSVHLYRFKKEILGKENAKDNFNNVNNLQSYLFKWTSSLRRPQNFYGKRESYINVSSDTNPLWSIVVEKYPITKEISIKSGYDLDNNQEYKEFIRKKNIDNDKIKNLESLDTIEISGKKLYDLEYEREMSSNNSYILHKVFVDNGKVIMYKDVNNIFGHETIYKNYSNNCLYKKKLNRDLIFGNRSMKDIGSNKMDF